jgi:ornithine cyclodeaminase/alanine dehydrogenase-like protein (mu-crystallin family)
LLFLSRADVERLLDPSDLIDALEGAFVAHSAGRSDVPPRVAARTANGYLGAMPGALSGGAGAGGGVAGGGLGAKLVSVYPGNAARGRPSHQALIALFDAEDGTPLAVMDGAHVTAVRTAAATAVSVRHLARDDAGVLAILGAGVQGSSHLAVVPLSRRFEEVRVASRDPARAAALARGSAPLAHGHTTARAVGSFAEAVRGADVVCCCTDADEPVVRLEWLGPGCHVTSVGSRAEVDPAVAAAASVFVEWRGAVTNPPPAGAPELQGVDPGSVTELGEVLAGARPGRTSRGEITLYRSTGHAVEDVAAARLVYDRALATGSGTRLSL